MSLVVVQMSDKTKFFVVVVCGWEGGGGGGGVEDVCDFFTSSKGKFPKFYNLTFELFPDLIKVSGKSLFLHIFFPPDLQNESF